MTWVRHDDGAPTHPKHLRLSDAAFRLWYNGLAHANLHATDGLIAREIVHTLDYRHAWTKRQLAALVQEIKDAKLWKEVSAGYEIHDYEDYQEEATTPVRAARREAARERKRRQRERERARKTGDSDGSHAVTGRDTSRVTDRDCHADGHAGVTRGRSASVTQPKADARAEVSQPPDPSRPVPTRPESSLRSDGRAREAPSDEPDHGMTDEELVHAAQAPSLRSHVLRLLREGYERKRALQWPGISDAEQHVQKLVRWLEASAAKSKLDAHRLAERVIAAWYDDEWASERDWPLGSLAKRPGRYLQTPKPRGPAKGPVPPAHESHFVEGDPFEDYDFGGQHHA